MIIIPLIVSIITPSVKRSEYDKLMKTSGTVSYVPFVIMIIISLVLSTIFIAFLLQGVYHSAMAVVASVLIVLACVFAIALLPNPLRRRINNIEKRFISNINERENRRTGHENNLVSDLHLAYITVGHGCPFVGDRLRNLDLRSRYGVNIAYIQRDRKHHPVPSGDMRIFPGDVLGVIATEEQIQRLLPLIEAPGEQTDMPITDVKFVHFAITRQSPIVGKALENTNLREDYGALLVAVQRGEEDYIYPTPDLVFKEGDILWIVGNIKQLATLKG